jgi:hypothetical protein
MFAVRRILAFNWKKKKNCIDEKFSPFIRINSKQNRKSSQLHTNTKATPMTT